MENQAVYQKVPSEKVQKTFKRSDEIRSIITLKLQACEVIQEAAYEKILSNLEDIKVLARELQEITSGKQDDPQIVL